jgi:hypothetical protein
LGKILLLDDSLGPRRDVNDRESLLSPDSDEELTVDLASSCKDSFLDVLKAFPELGGGGGKARCILEQTSNVNAVLSKRGRKTDSRTCHPFNTYSSEWLDQRQGSDESGELLNQ